MTSDFSSDPQPENPFASPQSEITSAPVMPTSRTGKVCDGTCMDSLKMGWELMTHFFWPFLGYSLVCGFIRIPADNLDNIASMFGEEITDGMWIFSNGYDIFVAAPLSMGLTWVFLKAARYEHFTLSDIFAAFSRNYLHAVGAGLVKALLILAGLILLVVPGLYLLVKLAFVEYLIVDRKMGMIEAMKESWRITDGREGTLFALLAMSVLIFLGGMLLCLVGAIPALIWISAAYAVLYHTYCLVDRPTHEREPPERLSDSDNPYAM
ncbi:hypothetical protein [Bremerella alba]|uniref:DUF7847 domain-containing protein n=1 Tax=Bremerella alba TaxID=980252 RepID=A0A7V9A8H9_9BACT|nr:hypothetical protein [Bremerella alba]MBA2116510.1 hypothetical protein [Bremerella alba]